MSFIRKETLTHLLKKDLSIQDDKVEYQKHGSLYDPWTSVMEGKEECWLSPNEIKKVHREKIIFCCPIIAEQSLNSFELGLLRALIKHGDVYLWKGPSVALELCERMTSIEELIEKMEKAFPATAENVERALTTQGIAANQFIILDYKKYVELLKSYDPYKESNSWLDLRWQNKTLSLPVSQQLEKFDWDSINCLDITGISIIAPNEKEINILLQKFPNLRQLTVLSVNDAWLLKYLHLFHDRNIALCFRDGIFLSFTLPAYNIPNITIEECRQLGFINILENLSKTTSLTYNVFYTEDSYSTASSIRQLLPREIKITGIDNLKSLKRVAIEGNAEKIANVEREIVSKSPLYYPSFRQVYPNVVRTREEFKKIEQTKTECKTLVCEHVSMRSYNPEDFSAYTQLKVIVLKTCIGEIKAKDFPQLEYLSLIHSRFSLNSHSNLRSLIIEGGVLNDLNLELFPELEELIVVYGNIGNLNLKSRSLKKLSLVGMSQFVTLDLKDIPNVQELILEGVYLSDPLNFSDAKKLYRLIFSGEVHPRTTLVFDNPSLSYLNLNLRGIMDSLVAPSINAPNLRALYIHLNLQSKLRREVQLSSSSALQFDSVALNINCNKLTTCFIVFFAGQMSYVMMNCPSLNALSTYYQFENSNNILMGLEKSKQLRFLSIPFKNVHFALLGEKPFPVELRNILSPDCVVMSATTVHSEQKIDFPPSSDLMRHVSLLSNNNPDLEVDSKTDKIVGAYNKDNNEIKVILDPPTDIDNFRMHVLDRIMYDEKTKKVKFKSERDEKTCVLETDRKILSYTPEKHAELIAKCNNAQSKEGLSYLGGPLTSQSYWPLSTLTPVEDPKKTEIYVSPPNAVQVRWNKDQKEHFIEVINPAKKIEVLYKYERDPAYFSGPTDEVIVKNSPILHVDLIKAIEEEFKSNKDLEFLFDEKLTVTQKINLLTKYFKEDLFVLGTLEKKSSSDIDILLELIEKQIGHCRHRAQAFMLLAHYLKVPVVVIVSEQHARCDIPYVGGLRFFNIGGADVPDNTSSQKRAHVLEKCKEELPIVTIEKKWEMKYDDDFKAFNKPKEIKSVDELLSKGIEFPPLIGVKPEQNALKVKNELIARLKEKKQNYIYIHSPNEFNLYLNPNQLEKGQCKKIAGPLVDLLKEGGALVVNWSNFDAQEIVSYQSILDTPPTLSGYDLKKVSVIGIKTENTAYCDAFASRCQPAEWKVPYKEIKKIESKEKPIEIDLFKQKCWKELFLGEIEFLGHAIELKESLLLKAINENKSIVIYNPPDDEEFNVLIDKMKNEGRFLYNGKLKKIPENCTIEIKRKDHPLELKNVSIVEEKKENKDHKEEKRNRIYIGLHNIHDCRRQLLVDNKTHQAKYEKSSGYLKQYNSDQDEFYLTDVFSQSDWAALLNEIQKNDEYKNKPYRFVLGPNAGIEGLKINSTKEEKEKSSSVFSSNDPDFKAMQLASENENTLIIDVMSKTGFHELGFQIATKQQEKSDVPVHFEYEEKILLQELKKGRYIILNGEISPTLYKQLLPLLTPPPHLYANGKKIMQPELKGSLKIVMSTQARKALSIIQYEETLYSTADYQAKLAKDYKDNKEDALLIPRVEKFFELAKKLLHQGIGRPEEPKLTYTYLKNILRVLKNSQLHPHNPIKGLFLYDYPKNSMDYAYLNVMGKYLFKPDDKTPYRKEKLLNLVAQLEIKNKDHLENHIWKILNCYNGYELNQIFGNQINAIFSAENYLTLKPEIVDIIWKKLIAAHVEKTEKKLDLKKSDVPVYHVKKREAQLQYLLKDPETPVIFLKGPPGVGKTFTVNQLKGKNYFEGEDQIEAWLNAQSDSPIVLLLDEANLALPGTWDFLKGLSRDGKSVCYKGKEYKLSSQHKIIATGNPENLPGRHYHEFFQHYATTLYFKMPEIRYLEEKIVEPILENHSLKVHTKELVKIYELIQEKNPLYTYSMRDLENLSHRFVMLAEEKRKPVSENLFRVSLAEFSGTILDKKQRYDFEEKLKNILFKKGYTPEVINKSIELKLAGKPLFVPAENAYLVEGIRQNLTMREKFLAQEKKQDGAKYKQGMLLEGAPGVGKSTLYMALLEEAGFTQCTIDTPDSKETQKRYYVINAGDKTAAKVLRKAYREGAVVILNELNATDNKNEKESIEKLLNQLLTRKDINHSEDKSSNLPIRPGFMVLASQNSGDKIGRNSISPALRNRMHMMYVNPYSREGLCEIAEKARIPYPHSFVDAFLKSGQTMRAFYKVLSIIKERENFVLPSFDFLFAQTKSPLLDENRDKKIFQVSEMPILGLHISQF